MIENNWPSDKELVALVEEAGSKAEAARLLEKPISTFKDRYNRIAEEGFVDNLSDEPSEEFIEIPVFFRDYSHLEKLHVYPLGDLHIGSPAHAADRWAEWVNYLIDTPCATFLGTGDNFNAALKDSKSEAYDEILTVGQAKRKFQHQIKPLSDSNRIDLLMPGNHEARIYRAIGDCPVEDISYNLGINYARSAAIIVYKVGDIEYEVYVRHGTGASGTNIGSRANQLQRAAHVAFADIYVSGHTHSQMATSDIVFVREENVMKRKRRLYVSSGSFLNYEDYASERGYVAGKIGAPRIHLSGKVKDAHCSI